MVSIYLIEDINDLRYVGSTTQRLDKRLSGHRTSKKIGQYCSSSELNLYNCIITQLEQCNPEQRKEREKYYINEIDCVNKRKLNFDKKECNKEWYQKNKEKRKEYYKLDWYCSHCDCNVKRCNKSTHFKSHKHQINTNNYLREKKP